MSSTVAKAIALLDYFSEEDPMIGLSDLARRSKIDKATVHRMMNVMADAGLVEQHADSKLYRLGAGIIRMARIRETCFPVTAIIDEALESLMENTGETSHASMISGRALGTIGICDSHKSSRVSLEAGQLLSFTGTASGLAALAFSDLASIDRVLGADIEKVTQKTITDPAKIQRQISAIKSDGFAYANQTFEDDVYGIASPIFDETGFAVGSMAVASPAHRMTDEKRLQTTAFVVQSAKDVTAKLGGKFPASYKRSKAFTL
jgi:IclR family transcriptional regulator, acetate operon repressor